MNYPLPSLVAASVTLLFAGCSSGTSSSPQPTDAAVDSPVGQDAPAVATDASLSVDSTPTVLDAASAADAPGPGVDSSGSMDGTSKPVDSASTADTGSGEVSRPNLDAEFLTAMVVMPTSGDLGAVLLGQMGVSVVFTVRNPGPLESGALTVATSRPELVMTNDTCSGQSLRQGMACTLAIAFKPSSKGALTATLTVAGPNASVVKTVTGTGIVNGQPNIRPAALDFGDVPVGTTSPGQTVTLPNYGDAATAPLSLIQTGQSDSFVVSNNTCVGPLAPGMSCTFTVSFAPTKNGAFMGAITITDGQSSATVLVSGSSL